MARNEKSVRTANDSGSESNRPDPHDPQFEQQVQRLYQLMVYARWLVVGLLWLTIAPICLWTLRSEFALWLDYFTWTALRYGLAYHRLATFGLVICIGMTVSTLVWQSRNLLWQIPPAERQRLEKQVMRIRSKGNSHWLWKWVCDPHSHRRTSR